MIFENTAAALTHMVDAAARNGYNHRPSGEDTLALSAIDANFHVRSTHTYARYKGFSMHLAIAEALGTWHGVVPTYSRYATQKTLRSRDRTPYGSLSRGQMDVLRKELTSGDSRNTMLSFDTHPQVHNHPVITGMVFNATADGDRPQRVLDATMFVKAAHVTRDLPHDLLHLQMLMHWLCDSADLRLGSIDVAFANAHIDLITANKPPVMRPAPIPELWFGLWAIPPHLVFDILADNWDEEIRRSHA